MTHPNPLTDLEKNDILECLNLGLPIPIEFHERLFPNLQRPISKMPKTVLHTCVGYGLQNKTGELIAGDNLQVLEHLSQLQSSSSIKLIYIDPPFDVGADFAFKTKLKNGRSLSQVAYSDNWGQGKQGFLHMLGPRLKAMIDLLDDTGSIVVHCDYRTSASIRLILNTLLGEDNFRNEIIWHYTGGGRAKKHFSRKHDTLLWYSKSNRYTFNLEAIRVPYKKSSGYARSGIVSRTGKHYTPNPNGTPVDDVWNIPIINPMAHERVGYPTQKPLALLNRIIEALTNEGDLVADFFCGSGTTLMSAERLGRLWLGVDASRLAIASSIERLMETSSFNLHELVSDDTAALRQSDSSADILADFHATDEGLFLRLEGLHVHHLLGLDSNRYELKGGLLYDTDGQILIQNALDWLRSWSLHDTEAQCVAFSNQPQSQHLLPRLKPNRYHLRLIDITGGHHVRCLELNHV